MNYFLIRDNKKCSNRPEFLNLFQKFDERALMKEEYWNLPYRTLIEVRTNESIDFIDVIGSPLFLLSKPIMKLTAVFEPNIEWKQIIAVERKNEMIHQYYLPLLPWINCIYSDSMINQDRSIITKCCLNKNAIGDKSIFYLDGLTSRNVIVREDLLEGWMQYKVYGVLYEQVDLVSDIE